MPSYKYSAKAEDGRTVDGVLEVSSEKVVLDALHRQGLMVLSVKLAKGGGAAKRKKVGMDDVSVFARQMATLVDAGIPIVGGLEAVADQLENKSLQQTVLRVREAVENGTNFTSAIAKENTVFSSLFVSMVRAGEASGHLSEVLSRLATYLEKSAALQRKVKSACVYPVIVIGMAAVITGVLMLKVIPAFKDIFMTLGADLPLPTKILIAVSDLLQRGFFPLLAAGFLGVLAFRRAIKTPAGQLRRDRLLLKLAIVGPIVRKVAIAKFARTLSTLISSGVQILSALEIVADSAGNRVVAEAILKVRVSIREGENIAGPLAASGVFPPMVVRMIAVGEQTGRLDEMLVKVADFYEDQVDTAISGLTSALEPVIIAVLGIVVGSIVLAIFLPIFKLTEVLGS
ncbi:MAG: type II secretion system F family protein [Candidatus Omnitrophica bacterium]|nr:type II secretion system F family protein [Candidatus Omnitrophota bacterium]